MAKKHFLKLHKIHVESLDWLEIVSLWIMYEYLFEWKSILTFEKITIAKNSLFDGWVVEYDGSMKLDFKTFGYKSVLRFSIFVPFEIAVHFT